MAAPTWTTRPAYTPDQVSARFGAGARLVRRGDGKWTIAGGVTSAPVPVPGAPINPATGQPYLPSRTGTGYGPGVVQGPGTPATAAGPASAPVPAAPGLPVSFGQQAGIDAITGRISSQPGIFNPQRLALFAEGGRALTDQGYYDTAQTDVASTTADGSTSYRIVAGPDGQLYREAVNDTAAAANSRGMLFSSARREAESRRVTDLNNARQAILRGLSGQQDSITAQQLEGTTSLRGDLTRAQGDYADWRASQPVPVAPPSAPMVTAPGPAGPAGPNNPRAAGRLVLPGPPAPPPPPRVTHRRQGVRR